MDSRKRMIQNIRNNKPAYKALAAFDYSHTLLFEDKETRFVQSLANMGGKGILIEHWKDLAKKNSEEWEDNTKIINLVPELGETATVPEGSSLQTLFGIEKVIIRGQVGVAENGAVWITESATGIRVLPFVCEELIIVLPGSDIVSNMHEAYKRIGQQHTGYGVFIAGPSKSADIEQTLVIGAQGPLRCTVFILKNDQ